MMTNNGRTEKYSQKNGAFYYKLDSTITFSLSRARGSYILRYESFVFIYNVMIFLTIVYMIIGMIVLHYTRT